MIVSDIADDVLFLGCKTDPTFFRRISMALEMLSNKSGGMWTGMVGHMHICVDERCITLPRDVRTPKSVNYDNVPTFARDEWFVYHQNGPGEANTDYSYAWEEVGYFTTIRELTVASKFIVFTESAADDGKTLTLRGTDSSDKDISEVMTMSYATPVTSTYTYKTLYQHGGVTKDVTTKAVQLYAYPPADLTSTVLIGWYDGDESRPRYRRIRINSDVDVVSVGYIRRSRDVTALTDYIPLNSRLAVIEACRAVHHSMNGNKSGQQEAEMKAVQYLEESQDVDNIDSPVGPQVMDLSEGWNESLWY